MQITIRPVLSPDDEVAIADVREQVFKREKGIELPPLLCTDPSSSLHLLARVESDGRPIAALSVVDTSGNCELHQSCGLEFPAGAFVARLTRLAVINEYRGLNIPMMLMLEAHRRFIVPGRFGYSWLLFDAHRALSSELLKGLAFVPRECVVLSEYGPSRALVRDEGAPRSGRVMREAEEYLRQLTEPRLLGGHFALHPAARA